MSEDRDEERGTVLIVEDSHEILSQLTFILGTEGYRVRAVPSGLLALRAAEAETPDLVLSDIGMPEMSGLELCRRLHELEAARNVPVVFISGMDDMSERIRAFEAGGVDFIGKPYRSEEVLVRVNTHVSLHRMRRRLEQQNEELRRLHNELEAKVKERTLELEQVNMRLANQIAGRTLA